MIIHLSDCFSDHPKLELYYGYIRSVLPVRLLLFSELPELIHMVFHLPVVAHKLLFRVVLLVVYVPELLNVYLQECLQAFHSGFLIFLDLSIFNQKVYQLLLVRVK